MGAEFNGRAVRIAASRGSRESPEVGGRRMNDTNISRIFFFLLEGPGLPGDAYVYWVCTHALKMRLAAWWWRSFRCQKEILQVQMGLNLYIACLCESPWWIPEIRMGVYKSERSCIWQLQGALAQASCILDFVYFDVLWRVRLCPICWSDNGYLEEQQFSWCSLR